MDSAQLHSHLCQQLQGMQLDLSSETIAQLESYLQLLIKWNKAFNLTAVRNPLDMISRHLLDSLSVLPFIEGPRLIDVGSGPGLPGIPLAICRPDIEITTLDSNGKKTRFQTQVKTELGLTNLTVLNQRAELCEEPPFDQVISRAFASIQDMLQWTEHLCRADGTFLAMKGLYPADELGQLPSGFKEQHCYPLAVPGTDGERHLIVIGRT